ncbi:putative lipoprotein [Leptospira yanagawae serovar Saopaulo str. Sao Paulo = ATCC 700523]|uniref:Putative lipoprotein n=1 Tax=Leptospira yanagawae serovar Saopaulo str. Sao Paulo = ATCC 700523 TaxID=1249483 RepID=A0A5E8HAN9_9LEPT|nr:lipoprotein [Leptospira yanagawae]EOQ87827.1 putative lipoprotein [Leptospira yanagawae serovar Saopaulo str. Sao Paulo = ATCC 700523]
MIFIKQKSHIIITLSLVSLLVGCSGSVSAGDTFLFGISERFEQAFGSRETPACSSDVTISTKLVSLVEDGDVNSTFSTVSENGLTDVDTDGGTAWGYRSFQTCIYPNVPFSGSLDIPVSITSNYGTRITSLKTFPAPDVAIPTKLTFTGNGVAVRQCFTFTVAQDAVRSAKVDPMTVALGTMTQKNGSGEEVSGTYTGKDACDISVSLEDDEGPGVRVSNISRVMEEPGPSATATNGTFQVRLRTAPTANVTIPINEVFDSINANNREGTANPKTLTFTNANFATEQTVTISSVDDLEIDGIKVYTVEVSNTSSADADYNGIKPRNVVVYNRDQSVPGYAYIRFDSTSGTTGSAGGAVNRFATDESNQLGTKYSNFQLKLRTKPTNNVTLSFSSNCGNKCTILTPTLTFSPTDWNNYQTFRVEGKSDSANTGNADYTVSFVASSADATYNTTVAEPTFSIRSCDNDGTHLLQPCNFSGSPRGTSDNRLSAVEGGSTNIWLISQSNPGSDVTIGLLSSDTSEGTVPATVTVGTSNFNFMESGGTNQIVLTHVDDALVDLNQNWTVTTLTSSGGLTYDPIDVYATTTDDEKAFYISHVGNTNENTTNTATVSVCLGGNNPTQPVILNISCKSYTAGTAASGECGAITSSPITFPVNSEVEPGNASDVGCASSAKKQTFTVTGLDDTYADGNQSFDIQFVMAANTDTNYQNAANPGDHSITNEDDEPAGKAIFVTTSSYNGEMTAQGVFAADDTCNNNKPGGVPAGTYKALIVSNSGGSVTNDRIPNGTNWVLTAGRHYYRCNSSGYSNCSDEHSRLFIANGTAGFDPTNLLREFSTIGHHYWTGMTNTLTPATQASTPACTGDGLTYRHNCHGFTYQNCPSSPTTFLYGQSWTMNSSTSITSQESVCSETKRLICVQQ